MKILKSNKKYFAGNLYVNGQNVFVNMKTGEGVFEVFNLMNGLLNKLANKYSRFSNISIDDAKQDVCVWMLEGMVKYDVTKNASLSTFLYTLIERKIIDNCRRKNIIDCDANIEEYEISSQSCDPIAIIDVKKHTSCWNNKWKHIISRIFLDGDKISDIAHSEEMSPWGLTRAVHKKLKEARKTR